MVPRDQMSSGQEYLGEPSSTSGALENTVETGHQNNHASFRFENITPVPKCHYFMCVDAHRNPKSSGEIMLNHDHLSTAAELSNLVFSELLCHLAKPKSAILIAPCSSIKRLAGFKSLQVKWQSDSILLRKEPLVISERQTKIKLADL